MVISQLIAQLCLVANQASLKVERNVEILLGKSENSFFSGPVYINTSISCEGTQTDGHNVLLVKQ